MLAMLAISSGSPVPSLPLETLKASSISEVTFSSHCCCTSYRPNRNFSEVVHSRLAPLLPQKQHFGSDFGDLLVAMEDELR